MPTLYRDAAERLQKETPNKLAYKRAKRALNQLAKHARPRSQRFYEQHPWAEEAERQANDHKYGGPFNSYRWTPPPTKFADRMQPAELMEEIGSHGVQRLTFSRGGAPSLIAQLVKAKVRKLRTSDRDHVREVQAAARAEEAERHTWLRRVARHAERVSKTVGGACRVCHEHDACMLVLRCGHVTACRACWEAQEHKRCAECGGESKLALQIYRPL